MQATGPLVRSMKLCEIFPPEATIVGLEHHTKPLVVAELVHRLVDLGRIPGENEPALVEAFLARERSSTTALWQGMAMPNVRTSLTDWFAGVLAVDQLGVDFEAIGGGAVKVLFLLVAPLESRADCFEVLGKVAAVGKNKSLVLQLAGCRSAEEVQRVLREIDRP